MAIISNLSPKRLTTLPSLLIPLLSLSLLLLFYAASHLLPNSQIQPQSKQSKPKSKSSHCDLTTGRWVFKPDPNRSPLYDSSCPFHRNAWNCLRNGRSNMDNITSWVWVPFDCHLPRIDPREFLESMRGKRIGFVGDSLNENFLVSFLCVLRGADRGARKWKRKGAWRGGYFPEFDVTVAYHRAVLLAKYTWQPVEQLNLPNKDGLKGIYKVDVDMPADDWINVTKFYDVLVFNTGHWWGLDKFPKETPLVFYREGKPIVPSLGILDGLQVVLESMTSYIGKQVPKETIKFWRTQSPRHFYGGDWDRNGSCLFTEPLKQQEVLKCFYHSIPAELPYTVKTSLARNNGVNMEAREINRRIEKALQGSDIWLLNLTHLSEFRADAHPAIWLGKKDAVAVWGQDCMHWCLPGVPDTWVDILSAQIMHRCDGARKSLT